MIPAISDSILIHIYFTSSKQLVIRIGSRQNWPPGFDPIRRTYSQEKGSTGTAQAAGIRLRGRWCIVRIKLQPQKNSNRLRYNTDEGCCMLTYSVSASCHKQFHGSFRRIICLFPSCKVFRRRKRHHLAFQEVLSIPCDNIVGFDPLRCCALQGILEVIPLHINRFCKIRCA